VTYLISLGVIMLSLRLGVEKLESGPPITVVVSTDQPRSTHYPYQWL
jgi:hypothetical protein